MNLFVFNEDFVQFIWKFSLFHKENLRLSSGESIQIIYPGTQNFAGGPDFLNAKIYIGDTLWVGNVEIHIQVKHWHQHKHSSDAAYNNIILHVVYGAENESVQLENGRYVPSLSIGSKVYENTLAKFRQLSSGDKSFIPCQSLIHQIDAFTFRQFYESLLFERLERKVIDFERDLHFYQGDIDAAFHVNLFKYFGAPLNKENFELLARSFSLKQLATQQVSKEQLESFLFGLADLLQDQNDYAKRLSSEFAFTKRRYQLKKYCKHRQWHFAGVRPPNFPTLRIAQLAALLYNKPRMFSFILDLQSLKEVRDLFKIEVSDYWQTHYSFAKPSKQKSKNLSFNFVNKLIINLVVPALFFYGKYIGEDSYIERAIKFLEETKRESNAIISGFTNLNVSCENAFDSQALIALKNEYCDKKKCLDCRIGFALLK